MPPDLSEQVLVKAEVVLFLELDAHEVTDARTRSG
jgi:hypothetical protein